MAGSHRIRKRYNLWYGNTIDGGFARPLYIANIGQHLGSKVVKVLTGQRRAGNYEKIVVSLDGLQLPSRNGIRHIRAWDLPQVLYKQFTLKLQGCDLLARNRYTTSVMNVLGRTETFATTPPRYVLFSLYWNFNKTPKRK